jgi:uncharacterized OsmC-like protein
VAEEDLIDHERIARAYGAAQVRMLANPDARQPLVRAHVRVVKDFRKEARTGRYTFMSDEPSESGGDDSAPWPLHYFVAGIGF